MNVQELLSYQLSDEEKYKSDLANMILDAFNGSYKPHCFGNIQFHATPSNNPNGYRVIFIIGRGFTLVQGDGDKGLGWIIDGVTYYENINNNFYLSRIDKSANCSKNEIGFIESFEDFLNYVTTNVFKSSFNYKDILKNNAVERVLINNRYFY